MAASHNEAVDILVVAVPETAGSALYGMVDVLSAAGNLWSTLTRARESERCFRVRIVSHQATPFRCGNGIPVAPDHAIVDDPAAPIVIVPELWLGPDESMSGRHVEVIEWLRRRYRDGAYLYSACSGALFLAETGLLDGCPATSHWGYADLFRVHYPKVRFDPAPNLAFARADGRIVTAGGTTSWHDLALHIIGRHASPGEALRIAKVYLMKWHAEGQLPYSPLVTEKPHGDAVVRRCERWLGEHWLDADAVGQVAKVAGIPQRTLERRFKAATGCSLLEYLQSVRIEQAKHLLETGGTPLDEIVAECGYADVSSFRRLFKRLTGLTPGQYRRLFRMPDS
ncbi:GlxA family transcriptional regulator [Rivibacter subsaxonicus]|uniref:AraC family transcriptional regulator with amidase-like domain n=1 Tax=Rivibacter subsaxonicus TaxID=457575 RepID=A0A4Q7VN50_9BURK|nr:helix-turn-helix domain-containing protein [Rivibacter subsaxonicus]RZT97771.1 AraC family transcriptional regulator with amidase-like domain [Rivibacter subsaxonicus]